MAQLLYRCLPCGALYDNQCEKCPRTNYSPHDEETVANIVKFLFTTGWRPGMELYKELHKDAIRAVVYEGYGKQTDNKNFELLHGKAAADFLRIIEQK